MQLRQTDHPFRNIRLGYRDGIEVTEADREFLNTYVMLHHEAQTISANRSFVFYEFGQFDEAMETIRKKFSVVRDRMKSFLKEAEVLVQNTDNTAEVDEMMDRVNAFVPEGNEFRDDLGHMMTLSEHLTEVYDNALEGIVFFRGSVLKYQNLSCGILDHPERYSLDVASYIEDLGEFLAMVPTEGELPAGYEQRKAAYNTLMKESDEFFDDWQRFKEMVNVFYDRDGMLDSSLSDSYATGTGDPSKKPSYFIPPDDPLVKNFRFEYGTLGSAIAHTLQLSVPADAVDTCEIAFLQELVLCFQHFPKLIERYVFAVKPVFLNKDGSPVPKVVWEGKAKYIRWFDKLNLLPFLIFFLEDPAARSAMLLGGEMIKDDIPREATGEKKGEYEFTFSGEALQRILTKMFHACWMFHMFCHNTGFDPQPYIEALLAEFDLPLNYEDIRKKYEEDIKSGMEFKRTKK